MKPLLLIPVLAALVTGCAEPGSTYEGPLEVRASYPDRERVLDQEGTLWLLQADERFETMGNPDLCDFYLRRVDGRLRIEELTTCRLGPNLAPREGTFVAAITESQLTEVDEHLEITMRGTIHQGTPASASEGTFEYAFSGIRLPDAE